MIRNKYERILDQFEKYYPGLYSQSVDWWSSGRMFITVKLKSGELFEFNPMDNSIRNLRVDEYADDEVVRRKAFGSNLEKLIPFSGLTKSELADKVGITKAMLSRYIRGLSMPSADKAYEIAAIIGCRLEELFDTRESD